MTRLDQPCAGTNAATVTTANATSGTQWNTVTATGAGTTVTYDNAHTIHSSATSTKLHYSTAASTDFMAWKAAIPTPTANAFCRFYFYKTADPSVAGKRISHMMSGLGVAAAALQMTTGGKLRLVNSAGTTISTMGGALPNNAWSRVEWEILGISGSTGNIAARFYSGANLEGTTPDETLAASAQAVTGNVNEVRYGCSTSITETTAWDMWIADAAWSDTAKPGVFGSVPASSAFLMFA